MTTLRWWTDVIPWKYLCKDLKSRGKKERKIVKLQAEHLYKAVQVYILLLSKHGSFLKERNTELLCIADNLDKVSKNTKIAGITGGATTVAGGVAAAAGVILSPFTLGVSLALTVIGVGVAAAGGVTGASAAIVNKVNVTQDKKKIEKTFQEYESRMEDIQGCLKFINEGMEEIKQHDLSFLIEAMKDSVKIAKVIQLVTTGGGSARALEATSKASGVMKGFALGIGIHFTKDKDGQRLKRGHESKLAKKIRTLAVDVSEALDELMQMKDMFTSHRDYRLSSGRSPALKWQFEGVRLPLQRQQPGSAAAKCTGYFWQNGVSLGNHPQLCCPVMRLSQLALEDVEALYLGPSFLMADRMGPLLDQDEEEALSPSSSLEGKAPASPPLSFSSYASSPSPCQTLSSSPFSSASPPPSPPPPASSFLGTKAGVDSLSLPWLGASDLLNVQVGADDGKADDAFAGMDWMSEKIDLSEFDLDSLIGSCSSDESPSSPEDLLASLDSHMDLDLDSFDTTIPAPT
ncbi:Cyclic AMP-dependent transcription factor ATF-4 [Larimichthys crocea]|uniref:Cyclic AMP-dependent transcription factor ATF-4 n=1 Tax=Larimichthys crocea TaxID=215358 RepID=A0A6G0JA88_LARCR|nr:Cyclic AMP-dependent transcription factor ATF-4 [Larimichthys crocea]